MMQHIQEGSGLNVAMSKSKLFPPVLIQMCAIGEETGSLAAMLEKALKGSPKYYTWIGFLLVVILGGSGVYLNQLTEGLTITGMSRDVSWGSFR